MPGSHFFSKSVGLLVAWGLESWGLLPVWERPQLQGGRGCRAPGSYGVPRRAEAWRSGLLGWASCPVPTHCTLFLRWMGCQACPGTRPLHPGPWPLGEPRVCAQRPRPQAQPLHLPGGQPTAPAPRPWHFPPAVTRCSTPFSSGVGWGRAELPEGRGGGGRSPPRVGSAARRHSQDPGRGRCRAP